MDDPRDHKGWHSRGYLPHLDAPHELQALTFRLADALPRSVLQRWVQELRAKENASSQESDDRSRELRRKIAAYEDAGYGACVLKNPECASIVQTALLHFDGERYRLLKWCIMPNHVHVLIHGKTGHTLDRIVKSWKTFTANKINELRGENGALWERDYHDRYIRSPRHLANVRMYIQNNPVKAGLCFSAEEWEWSSARWQCDHSSDN